MSAAEAFVDAQRDWLRGAVARAPETVLFEIGAQTPFRGGWLRIEADPRRGVVFSPPDALRVGGAPSEVGRRVEVWLREQARATLLERARYYAAAVGRPISKISIRDTRSRWGSCTSGGALSFSWRLIMAPDAVLDYVAAHEAAHLVEMNHSDRFWALVERLRPDWRAHRDWLRQHGAELHRYRAG